MPAPVSRGLRGYEGLCQGVDTIPPEEIENCRKICEEEIGAVYRVREYIKD